MWQNWPFSTQIFQYCFILPELCGNFKIFWFTMRFGGQIVRPWVHTPNCESWQVCNFEFVPVICTPLNLVYHQISVAVKYSISINKQKSYTKMLQLKLSSVWAETHTCPCMFQASLQKSAVKQVHNNITMHSWLLTPSPLNIQWILSGELSSMLPY